MKRLITLLIAIIIFSSITVSAQTRRRSTRPAVRAVPTVVSMAERQGAIRVADEIKTMTRFLYLLGGIVKGLEALDEAARGADATPALVEQAKRNKLTIKTSIQSIRERLDKLEIDFRNPPEL